MTGLQKPLPIILWDHDKYRKLGSVGPVLGWLLAGWEYLIVRLQTERVVPGP